MTQISLILCAAVIMSIAALQITQALKLFGFIFKKVSPNFYRKAVVQTTSSGLEKIDLTSWILWAVIFMFGMYCGLRDSFAYVDDAQEFSFDHILTWAIVISFTSIITNSTRLLKKEFRNWFVLTPGFNLVDAPIFIAYFLPIIIIWPLVLVLKTSF